jgi:DUF4097 and DUF4098 domain-containing protein YvlB
MNRLSLVLLGLAAIASPAAARDDALREQSERTFDATGLSAIEVHNPRGFVEVRPSGDGRVRLYAYKVVRAPSGDRQRLARETKVESSREGDRFVVRVIYPKSRAMRISLWEMFSGEHAPTLQVRLSIEVPRGFAVTLGSSSGDLRTARMAGLQTLATTSGDITIEEASGRVVARATSGSIEVPRGFAVTLGSSSGDLRTARMAGLQTLATTSGDITIEEASGRVVARATSGSIEATGIAAARLSSVSGDIAVEGASGPLAIRTTSGEISVVSASDSLRLDSVSGDVRASAAPRGLVASTTSGELVVGTAAGAVRLSSSSGDVDLLAGRGLTRLVASSVSGDLQVRLPRDLGATLALQTSSGALDVTLPMDVRTVTRHELRGTLGRGGVPVELRSSSGDIHVTSGGTDR